MITDTVKRGKPRSIRTDVKELFDGDCCIYRLPRSGRVFQFQMYVRQYKKYVRKSCKTKNVDNATSIGKQYYLEIQSKLINKETVFNKTFGDVVKEFLEEEKSLVGINKKKGSWRCVKGHLTNHLLGFVGEKTPLVDVKREKWMEYYHYREEQKFDIVNTTLLNEKYSIGSFYNFCIDKKYLDTTYLPKFVKIDSESRRRQHFTETEWKKIYSFFTTNEWKNPENDRIKELRLLVRDFIIILMNTGLRKGELKRVRWENVSIEKNKGKIDRKLSVRKTLDKTQTKTKKHRVVIGRRGDVFERVRGYSNYTEANDLVFVNNDTGNPIPDRYYYIELNFLIKSIGFDEIRRDNGFYCCRHSYITWRLLRGVDILSLSKNVGTSILMIQKHYEHVLMEMVGTKLVKDKDLSDTGVLIFD